MHESNERVRENAEQGKWSFRPRVCYSERWSRKWARQGHKLELVMQAHEKKNSTACRRHDLRIRGIAVVARHQVSAFDDFERQLRESERAQTRAKETNKEDRHENIIARNSSPFPRACATLRRELTRGRRQNERRRQRQRRRRKRAS